MAAKKTILVPIDFSPMTPRVVREAVAFARQTGGRPAFLHVIQPPLVVTDMGGMTLEDTAQLMTDARTWANKRLARLRLRLRTRGIEAETILETGAPVRCILAETKRMKASHILIGSHGHTAFYDLLIGSTARGVLKRANCPVVVVGPKKSARIRPPGSASAA